jgi:hypothetical protein
MVKAETVSTVTVTLNAVEAKSLYREESTYSAAWGASTADNIQTILRIGVQYYYDESFGDIYRIGRVALAFNTSSIPDSATITSASLSVVTNYVNDKLVIQSSSVYPHYPTVAADYAAANPYTTITTSNLISGSGVNSTITFSSLGLSYLNTTGISRFLVRTEKEANADGSYYSTSPVITGVSLTVTYSYVSAYSLAASDDSHSVITPSGTFNVAPSASQTFNITTDAGYEVFSVTVDGVNVGAVTSYTFSNISADHTIVVRSMAENAPIITFNGPYSEDTGLLLSENCTVTVYFSNGATPESFILNGAYPFSSNNTIRYYEFTFSDNNTRQYWPTELEIVVNVFYTSSSLTTYLINFLDYTGMLKSYPYVSAQYYVNGSLFTVEKRVVDAQNNIYMNLVDGHTYTLVIGDGDVSYIFGDCLMTSITAVQLYLNSADFSEEVQLMYKYILMDALRDFSSNSLRIIYEDTTSQTVSVLVEIDFKNGTNVFTYTAVSDSFSLNWTGVIDSEAYQVTLTVTHSSYGELTWKKYFVEQGGSTSPFDFSFLGSILGLDTSYLLPILLIIFVAACFSALNAEVAAVLAVIMGIIFSVMGWLPIPIGALIGAISLAILMALVYNKRRVVIY